MGSIVEVWGLGVPGPARSTLESATEIDGGSDRDGRFEGTIEPAPDLRLYISGDTLLFDGLREIPAQSGPIDHALVHLGGTRVFGVQVTMDASQGVELIRLLDPSRADAIHYDDYEAFASPIEDFVEAVAAAGLSDRVGVLRRGQTIGIGPSDADPVPD